MRKPTKRMIEALVDLFNSNAMHVPAHVIAPRSTVAGMIERGLITSADDAGVYLTSESGETGLSFLINTRRAVVARDGSLVHAQVEPMTDDEITAALIRFENDRAIEAEALAKADAIREKATPEFPPGVKLRNPETGTTFEVIEHTYAVRLRNVATGTMSAIPQDMARELDRVTDEEAERAADAETLAKADTIRARAAAESDRVHEDANLAWANTLRSEVRGTIAEVPLGAPVIRKSDGERGHVVAHHDTAVEVQPVSPYAGSQRWMRDAFELDTDPTVLRFYEPLTYLTDVESAWNLAWSMWNVLAMTNGQPNSSFYRDAVINPGHPARQALDALEGMGFVHAWNDGTGYAITPAGERADRHRHPVVVGSTVVNVLADGSTVVDVVDDEADAEEPAGELSPFEGLDALRDRNDEADRDKAALGETTADVISDTMKLLTGRITPAEYNAPTIAVTASGSPEGWPGAWSAGTVVANPAEYNAPPRTLPELVAEFDDAVEQTAAAIPAGSLADAAGALSPIERPRDCGWVWVAEIELCYRCGLNAEAHSGNTEHAYGATSRPLPVTGFLPALNAALTPGEAELLDDVDTTDVVEGTWLASAVRTDTAELIARGLAYRGSDRACHLTAVGAELVKYRRALTAAAKGGEYAEFVATNYAAQAMSPLNVVPTPDGFEPAGDVSDDTNAHIAVRLTITRLRRGLVLSAADRTALADLLDTVRRAEASYGHDRAFGAWFDVSNTYRAHFGDTPTSEQRDEESAP